jgi:hypothetical protein
MCPDLTRLSHALDLWFRIHFSLSPALANIFRNQEGADHPRCFGRAEVGSRPGPGERRFVPAPLQMNLNPGALRAKRYQNG